MFRKTNPAIVQGLAVIAGVRGRPALAHRVGQPGKMREVGAIGEKVRHRSHVRGRPPVQKHCRLLRQLVLAVFLAQKSLRRHVIRQHSHAALGSLAAFASCAGSLVPSPIAGEKIELNRGLQRKRLLIGKKGVENSFWIESGRGAGRHF
jgi:hypothetical protein